jgi:probable O-glycosylation ligase (exosortase A-associated)
MRDLLLFAFIFWVLLKVFARPHIGIYLWTWISLMNPHRLTWTLAFDFPFAAVTAGATMLGLLFSKAPRRMVWSRESVLLILFVLWMILTTLFAFDTVVATEYLVRVLKIELFAFLTIYLITDKEKLLSLLWVTVASLAFYGVKGGIFTVSGGGIDWVLGPEGSFIGGNNEIALALIMTVPLMFFLLSQLEKPWMRYAMMGAIFLTALAIVGSQSRGAFIGVIAMSGFLWLKSRHKILVGLLIVAIAITVMLLMPDTWWERMESIRHYQQDASAMGRINAWWTAWNVASDNLLGGGFKMFTMLTFHLYAPNPLDIHDAHSVYFQVLGEHGFIGLGLFLLLGLATWLRCGQMIRLARKSPELKWAGDLASMLQVSLLGYAVSGAFLGLAYFDYYYHLIAITLITWSLVRQSAPASSVRVRGRRQPLVPSELEMALAPQPASRASPARRGTRNEPR